MNSGFLGLNQIMSILLTMTKDCFFIAHVRHNLIKLYIIIDHCKLLTIFQRVLSEIQAN